MIRSVVFMDALVKVRYRALGPRFVEEKGVEPEKRGGEKEAPSVHDAILLDFSPPTKSSHRGRASAARQVGKKRKGRRVPHMRPPT